MNTEGENGYKSAEERAAVESLNRQNEKSDQGAVEEAYTNLEGDSRFNKLLEEVALNYLKTKDADYFYENYSGVAPSGYLIDRQGKETNSLPSQNLGGPAFAEVEAQAKSEFATLYPEGAKADQQQEKSCDTTETKSGESEIDKLSDKDFMWIYQESGFGWANYTDKDKPVRDRWKKIHEEHPEFFTHSDIGKVETSTSSSNSDEQSPDLMPNELTRNLIGQVVNPRTNEPVREGSPEWQELARRNMLPRNQRG
jgi:hypothetical protein